MVNRYYDLNAYLRGIFGCRVQKITIDAGLNCPNRDGTISSGGCIYCNTRGSGTGAHKLGHSITEQLLRGKRRLARRYKAQKFIAYFQSFSNTYAPLDTLKRLYEEALAVDDVVGLSIGTRPDCVNGEVLDMLHGYSRRYLVWIEYGLQSASNRTLAVINRGHDVQCFKDAVRITHERGLHVCAHVIVGLPGENRADILETAALIAALGIAGVKIHLLYVVKGTRLEELYRQGRYDCLDQRQYVELVCDFLERLAPQMVIQRLTGDPHPPELVAPRWALQKAQTLTLIRETLAQRDSWQGKFFKVSGPASITNTVAPGDSGARSQTPLTSP